MLHGLGAACDLVQTGAADPRLGRFLRRTSLDELPHVMNLVGGSMSLVGPRPHTLGTKAAVLPFEMAAAEYEVWHRAKPGITGWRGETDTVEEPCRRVEHDLHYIAHWSLWFDLRSSRSP
jgi:lipopolysaccharide/colanic/teichoic acid biosynthesis glycosyltransferase